MTVVYSLGTCSRDPHGQKPHINPMFLVNRNAKEVEEMVVETEIFEREVVDIGSSQLSEISEGEEEEELREVYESDEETQESSWID